MDRTFIKEIVQTMVFNKYTKNRRLSFVCPVLGFGQVFTMTESVPFLTYILILNGDNALPKELMSDNCLVLEDISCLPRNI